MAHAHPTQGTLWNDLEDPSPFQGKVRSIWTLCALVVAAVCFDRLAGDHMSLNFGWGLTIALILYRPDFFRPGLGVFFLTTLLAAIPLFGAASALGSTAITAAALAGTVFSVRRLSQKQGELPSTRGLLETIAIAAIGAPLLLAAIAAFSTNSNLDSLLDLTHWANWPKTVVGATAIIPIVALASSTARGTGIERTEFLPFMLMLAGSMIVAWMADNWLPFPFIVVSILLLLAASRLSPLAAAILGACIIIEMTVAVPQNANFQGSVSPGARAIAAVLVGILPTMLALIIQELRTERKRLTETGLRLRQVLAGIEDHAFCALDRHGVIVSWNSKISSMTKAMADVPKGQSFAIFFSPEDRTAGVPEDLLNRAVQAGRAESVGWRIRLDGTRFWARTTIEATIDENGSIIGFVNSMQDQTELQRSQNALLSAERRWGFALGSSGQGVWDLDLDTKTMHYSHICAALFGLTIDALGKDPEAWKALVHPDDVSRIPADSSEETGETELRIRHADGRWIWITERRRVAERDDKGNPTRIMGTITDITARKHAEEKFRLAVEASPIGILMVDSSGKISLVNSEVERMFGRERDSLLGRSIDILVPDSVRAGHAQRRAAYAAKPTARRMGAGRELNGRRQDGSHFPVEIGLNPITTTDGLQVLCTVTDITARKQAEAELALSEARYRSMAENFVDLIVQFDLSFTRTWVSPASMDILGIPPEKLHGTKPSDIVHPDDLASVEEVLSAVAAGTDRGSYTARYRHADGHWVWLSVFLRLVRDYCDEPMGIFAVARDITRARAAEEALKASEVTFRGAMEGASIGMALEELDGNRTSVNRALCNILGMTEDELLAVDPAELTYPEDIGIDDEQRQQLLANQISSYQIEKRWFHRSGRIVWTHQSISVDKASDGTPRRLILQIQDITERRQVEQMKSEFVSMVSHELRTPLTSIRGALGLILGTMKKDLPPQVVRLVDIAHKNSERLIPLVNDILDLDKIDSGMLRVDLIETDAAQLVSQAVEATRSFADRYGVSMTVSGVKDQIRVRVDEGRFNQVVTNLISNAAKFSPRGANVEVTVAALDTRLRISVKDYGPGIPEEFKARIFGRFAQADSATTRAKDGSGLGLHICKQLTGLMGGEIGFESTVGVGSTFWVEFPLANAQVKALPQPSAGPAEADAKIMILSDDQAFTELLISSAKQAGLNAIVASAENAPNQRPGEEIEAALVDVALAASDKGGGILAQLDELAGQRPPVILVGDADPAIAKAWRAHDAWGIAPDAPHELVRRLTALVAPASNRLPTVLHIEDDSDLAAVIAAGLSGHAKVFGVARISQALNTIQTRRFDLAIIDPILPDGDALAILTPHLERLGIPVLVLSADETSDRDVAAIARIIKSRVSEPQIVEKIVSLLAECRKPKEPEKNVA